MKIYIPKKIINFIIIFVFIGNFLLPPISFFHFGIRAGDFIIILFFPFIFLLKVRKALPVILYLMLYASMIFSTTWGYAVLHVPASVRDWNELVRLGLPLIILVFAYNVKETNMFTLMRHAIMFGSIFLIFVAIFQYFFPHGLGGKITAFYTTDARLVNIGSYLQNRLLLTGPEPNTGASIAIFFAISNLSFYLSTLKYKYFFLFLTLTMAIGLTGSRTGILAFCMGCIMLIVFHRQKQNTLNLKKFLILSIVMLSLFLSAMQSDYITRGFSTAIRGENASVNVRLKNFSNAFELFKESPIFGWGPSKIIHETIVDGEYFLLLRRYGTIGFLLSLFFLWSLIQSLSKGANKIILIYGKSSYALLIALASYIFSMLVTMFTNNFILGYQLFLPILGLAGALHSLKIYAEKSQQ